MSIRTRHSNLSQQATEQEFKVSDTPVSEAPVTPVTPATPVEKRVGAVLPDPPKDWWWGTGRRKTSVARVRMCNGDGRFFINKREINDYFSLARDRNFVQAPLKATEIVSKVDVHVNVKGGGTTGQAGAIVLGIARALRKAEESRFLDALRTGGYLTRDSRMVERKKPGQPGARKKFQFSKR
jgi:small subunit ribosomal protein S9